MLRQRKKTWQQKVTLVHESFLRASRNPLFAKDFYENLFFLYPTIKNYFAQTDFDHQEKAIMHGMEFLMGFLDQKNENARNQILRISKTHSAEGMKIHPHHYYYWLEALIMTAKKSDAGWHHDLEYYWREVISFPVSFITSQYFNK